MKHYPMMMAALAAVVLSGCLSSGMNPRDREARNNPQANRDHAVHTETRYGNYQCQNGLNVQVQVIPNDQLVLRMDGKETVMNLAVSGSGERYVSNSGLFGTGGEWHAKGTDAFFSFADPYGNRVETACSAF